MKELPKTHTYTEKDKTLFEKLQALSEKKDQFK